MKTEVKLENGTVLEVGKRYTQNGWKKTEVVIINYIGKEKFFGTLENGKETFWGIDYKWLPYEEEKKDVQIEEIPFNNMSKIEAVSCKVNELVHMVNYLLEKLNKSKDGELG